MFTVTCANYSDGNFLAKWLAPILRNLADTPERMAELDVNEGIVELMEMRFSEKSISAALFKRKQAELQHELDAAHESLAETELRMTSTGRRSR